ncbi:MAG: ATP-binding protein [Balneolaceae bacterium]|nr:ATP-binding protein [Balneolaceae bacterium]
MVTLHDIEGWLTHRKESRNLEFKEAKTQYDYQKLNKYCVAIANEGGGFLVLGVSDKMPRNVVGTSAFKDISKISSQLYNSLNFRVNVREFNHRDGRIVVFDIPSRPKGSAYHLEGAYYMRSGQELTAMSPEQLKRIFNEDQENWLLREAKTGLSASDAIQLLDIQIYFDLLEQPLPSSHASIIEKFQSKKIVAHDNSGYTITNLGALLLAKDLSQFDQLYRKAPRVIVYKGKNRVHTERDQQGVKGYVTGFEGLVSFIQSQTPENEVIEKALRKNVKMYPKVAIRELVANALIHQDFLETGTNVKIEIFEDRIEFTNPGKPLIPIERFVDENKTRNEDLADIMRILGICEEKSSGIDKVVFETEYHQLPAPDFKERHNHTTVTLYSHKDFEEMDGNDKVRACYLHCCLRFVSNEKMTNSSLRDRFGLGERKSNTASQIIQSTIEAGLIKLDDPSNTSKRYAKYIPVWA